MLSEEGIRYGGIGVYDVRGKESESGKDDYVVIVEEHYIETLKQRYKGGERHE